MSMICTNKAFSKYSSPFSAKKHSNPSRVDQIIFPLQNKHFYLSLSYILHRLSTTSSSLDDQEGSSLRHTVDVIKVSSSDGKTAAADQIPNVTDDLQAISWEVWNAAVVLEVLGVAVSDNAEDTGLDCIAEVLDGAVGESGTLGVAAGEED